MPSKEWREKQKKRGLCADCMTPVKKGHVRCEDHLKINRESCLKEKKKRKEEGRCRECGKKMEEDDLVLRTAKFTCVNCSERPFSWR